MIHIAGLSYIKDETLEIKRDKGLSYIKDETLEIKRDKA